MSSSTSAKMKASELNLSEDELIAVMERVKAGNISIDEALAEVISVDTCRRDVFHASSAASSAAPSSSTAALAADHPGVARDALSETARLELLSQVKQGRLSIDQALQLAGLGGLSRDLFKDSAVHQLPMVTQRDLELRKALELAGAELGSSKPQSADIANSSQEAVAIPQNDVKLETQSEADQEADMDQTEHEHTQEQAQPQQQQQQQQRVQESSSHDTSEAHASAEEQQDHHEQQEQEQDHEEVASATETSAEASAEEVSPPAHVSAEELDNVLRLYGLSENWASGYAPREAALISDLMSTPQEDPKRVVKISLNKQRAKSAHVALPHTLPELLELASQQLGCRAKRIFDPLGHAVRDLTAVRDGDELLVSQGESYRTSVSRVGSMISLESCGSILSDTSNGDQPSSALGAWVRLNVGGTVFQTTKSTLLKEEDSLFHAMFASDRWGLTTDESGAVLLDRSPRYFEHVLNYLRYGDVVVDSGTCLQGVMKEAEFFGIWSLVDQLEARVHEAALKQSLDPPIRRAELVRLLLSTTHQAGLRCQGVNFAGTNLSKRQLDLRGINFKYACLDECDLSQCNLELCCFEKASLKQAKLDSSNLLGCDFSRAVLDNASIKDCNFHDPSQRATASLEGASCRGADFEESNLSCANMRVASFKGASLRNCNLRSSTLAGSDLGSCDLSGCNLQGTNLRGANTLRAKFHKISTAIHSTAYVDQTMWSRQTTRQ